MPISNVQKDNFSRGNNIWAFFFGPLVFLRRRMPVQFLMWLAVELLTVTGLYFLLLKIEAELDYLWLTGWVHYYLFHNINKITSNHYDAMDLDLLDELGEWVGEVADSDSDNDGDFDSGDD